MTNRFGRRLYSLFFKTYTEKVWGIPCSEIRAEWAAQRIKGLSFLQRREGRAACGNKNNEIKSLIEEFNYPRFGPGQMWELHGAASRTGRRGAAGVAASRRSTSSTASVVEVVAGGTRTEPSAVISSLPLRASSCSRGPPAARRSSTRPRRCATATS